MSRGLESRWASYFSFLLCITHADITYTTYTLYISTLPDFLQKACQVPAQNYLEMELKEFLLLVNFLLPPISSKRFILHFIFTCFCDTIYQLKLIFCLSRIFPSYSSLTSYGLALAPAGSFQFANL